MITLAKIYNTIKEKFPDMDSFKLYKSKRQNNLFVLVINIDSHTSSIGYYDGDTGEEVIY